MVNRPRRWNADLFPRPRIHRVPVTGDDRFSVEIASQIELLKKRVRTTLCPPPKARTDRRKALRAS